MIQCVAKIQNSLKSERSENASHLHSNHNQAHLTCVCHVVKYLIHTKDSGTWSISEQDKESGSTNVLFWAVDTSFAMCKLTHRSHLGYTTFLNHGLVS